MCPFYGAGVRQIVSYEVLVSLTVSDVELTVLAELYEKLLVRPEYHGLTLTCGDKGHALATTPDVGPDDDSICAALGQLSDKTKTR